MKKYLLLIISFLYIITSMIYSASKLEDSEVEEDNNFTNNIVNESTIDNATNTLTEINPLSLYTTNTNYTIIKVSGSAKVDLFGDKSASNKSIINSEKNAVSIVVDNILKSNVVLENSNIKKSKIVRDYKIYVKDYIILASKKIDNRYNTEIEAVIDYSMIKNYLLSSGVLNDENIKASISLVVLDNNENADNVFSSEVIKSLDESGFYPVENNYELLNNYLINTLVSYSNTTERKSIEHITKFISNENKSKYAIVGSVNAYFVAQIEGTSLITFRSVLNLNIIDMYNSKIITNIIYQTSASSGGYENAYDFVLKKTAKYASYEIIKTINKEIEKNKEPTEYSLIINDLNYEDSLIFQKEIKNNIELIKNVYNYGEQNFRQHLVVSFLGDIKTLAIELNVKARDIGFRIIIDSYDDTTIYLSAKKR